MGRGSIAGMLCATIALGVASRVWPIGNTIWDKSFGDVAYAIMIGFVILFVRPRTKPHAVGMIATAIGFALELFQLTGIPARAPRVLRIALGDTFAWHDMACYAIGGCLVALILRASSRARPST